MIPAISDLPPAPMGENLEVCFFPRRNDPNRCFSCLMAENNSQGLASCGSCSSPSSLIHPLGQNILIREGEAPAKWRDSPETFSFVFSCSFVDEIVLEKEFLASAEADTFAPKSVLGSSWLSSHREGEECDLRGSLVYFFCIRNIK